MNAKKIMGAVLVALLAAALFTGAVAAADKGTVFINQINALPGVDYVGAWNNGAITINVDSNGNVTGGDNFVPGTYKKGDHKVYVAYPTATITGTAGTGAAAYNFIGATLYADSTNVNVVATQPLTTPLPVKYQLTFENGTTLVYPGSINSVVENLPKGTYKIAVNFSADNFVVGADAALLTTAPVTFKVADADDATIAASVDQMIKGETFTITVAGQPGIVYSVTAAEKAFIVATAQPGLGAIDSAQNNFTYVNFTMPNTGKFSFTMAANASTSGDKQDIGLWYENASQAGDWINTKEKITVKFSKGAISAKTDAATYFVGDVVKVTGTTTAGEIVSYKINGTNFYYPSGALASDAVKYEGNAEKTFEFKINTKDVKSSGKALDVGTYTLTLVTKSNAEAVVPLTVKQPFISIIEAPEVIVQGEDEVQFIINAEATSKIGYYIFGTNYFACSPANTGITENVEDDEGEKILNQFIVELGEEQTENMAAGQYFAVFQHPMYDGVLAINGNADTWLIEGNGNTINVKERQTANAAQALCDALDAQNIDDMYVKYSFFVVGEDQSFTISEIPTEVAKGDKIVISGVSTANADAYVTAEMISTAFAAVPKETVGSAAFITVTTQIAEDGTWEVTFDTSDLNVDEYSLKVACGEETWKTVTVNVVEGAETPDTPDTPDVPDTPDTPDTPTEPETPGFGALAALAGLGAVAVLLLRRE